MILLIDNYDSFSYNLYQMIGARRPDIRVVRNDEVTVDGILEMAPTHVVLSPGPGRPEHAGVTMEAAKRLGERVPVLGVCLGHQAICAAFGGKVTYAKRLMHGKQSEVTFDVATPLFLGLPARAKAGRYHSLAVEEETLPDVLTVTARTDDGEIMAVQHKTYPIFGVQFHPESILTPDGDQILQNFFGVKA